MEATIETIPEVTKCTYFGGESGVKSVVRMGDSQAQQQQSFWRRGPAAIF